MSLSMSDSKYESQFLWSRTFARRSFNFFSASSPDSLPLSNLMSHLRSLMSFYRAMVCSEICLSSLMIWVNKGTSEVYRSLEPINLLISFKLFLIEARLSSSFGIQDLMLESCDSNGPAALLLCLNSSSSSLTDDLIKVMSTSALETS